MKHTHGPWVAVDQDENLTPETFIYGGTNQALTIASVFGCYPEGSLGNLKTERQANAHLIAAAPELLEACKNAHNQIIYLHEKFEKTGTGEQAIAMLKSAIAKAEQK